MGEACRTVWPLLCLVVIAERPPVSSGLNWFGEVKPEREWDYFERDRGKEKIRPPGRHFCADRSTELPRARPTDRPRT